MFYEQTPHSLRTRIQRHAEAIDERIEFVLETPEFVEPLEGNRYVCWRRVRVTDTEERWMKVVVVENLSGPAMLSAYEDDEVGKTKWGR